MSDGSILDAAMTKIPMQLGELTEAVNDFLDSLDAQLADSRGTRRDQWAGQFMAVLMHQTLSGTTIVSGLTGLELQAAADRAWLMADVLDGRDPRNKQLGVAAAGRE